MDGRREVRIPVCDLGCGGSGATTIERELAAMDGVRKPYVNPATEIACIGHDPTGVHIRVLAEVIEKAGWRAGRPFVHSRPFEA